MFRGGVYRERAESGMNRDCSEGVCIGSGRRGGVCVRVGSVQRGCV